MTETLIDAYLVNVYLDWDEFENNEHPKVKQLAKQYGVRHDGGGIGIGTRGNYEHYYYAPSQTAAQDFEKAVCDAGLVTKIEPPSASEIEDLMRTTGASAE